MPSPNHAEYVDLTIYDLSPTDIYNNAIQYGRTSLPDWEPRLGSIEDAILQGVAYTTSLLVNAINRLPNNLAEGIAKLAGFERTEATFATGSVEVEVVDNSGITIPVGTIFAYEDVVDDQPISYTFETTETLQLIAPDTTGTIAISGIQAGLYPELLDGQGLSVVSANTGILSVSLSGNLSTGSNSESDVSYFSRIAEHFASLSNCITTARQMTNYIAINYPSIAFFHVYDLTSTSDLSTSAADAPGYVTIVSKGAGGASTPSGTVTAMLADLEDKCVAGLTIQHAELHAKSLDVDVEVHVTSGYNTTTVTNAVESYLQSYLSYASYDFSSQIIGNALLSKISQIDGVDYVVDLTISNYGGNGTITSNNLSIDFITEVPVYGTITVTHS